MGSNVAVIAHAASASGWSRWLTTGGCRPANTFANSCTTSGLAKHGARFDDYPRPRKSRGGHRSVIFIWFGNQKLPWRCFSSCLFRSRLFKLQTTHPPTHHAMFHPSPTCLKLSVHQTVSKTHIGRERGEERRREGGECVSEVERSKHRSGNKT